MSLTRDVVLEWVEKIISSECDAHQSAYIQMLEFQNDVRFVFVTSCL